MKKLVIQILSLLRGGDICKSNSIKRYKNLRHDLSDFKRVHIDKSFVLTFKVDLANNFILFYDFDHHDKVY